MEEVIVNLESIIDKLLVVNPISAISIIFAFIFFWHSKRSMLSLEKIHKESVKEIKEAYSESVTVMKEFIESIKTKK